MAFKIHNLHLIVMFNNCSVIFANLMPCDYKHHLGQANESAKFFCL